MPEPSISAESDKVKSKAEQELAKIREEYEAKQGELMNLAANDEEKAAMQRKADARARLEALKADPEVAKLIEEDAKDRERRAHIHSSSSNNSRSGENRHRSSTSLAAGGSGSSSNNGRGCYGDSFIVLKVFRIRSIDRTELTITSNIIQKYSFAGP